MNTLVKAVVFLLTECVELIGARYVDVINHIADLERDDPVRGILREESDELDRKLGRAKAYLQSLKLKKV